jgi:hypothetical protein
MSNCRRESLANKPIGPNTRIESVKSPFVVQAGMRAMHPRFGVVRLVKRGGGTLWHCDCDDGHRRLLDERLMKAAEERL